MDTGSGAFRSSQEREQTDESLRQEREGSDRALARKQAADKSADAVVERARTDADAVLAKARKKADEPFASPGNGDRPRATVAEERVEEDKTLRAERVRADEILQRERARDLEALAALLPLEREKTDRNLLTERARSDNAVSHRDDFLGIVSHDLRSLLGGVVLSAGALARRAVKGNEGEAARTESDRIQRYAARMNRLIGDLTDVVSIDAGKLSLTRTRGDAGAVIDEAVDAFRSAAVARGITLASERVERPLLADFDHDRLLQVLANLITNAIKFSAQGGTIGVQGERAEGSLRLCVRDTGVGIPDNLLDTVFERFWQAGKSDKRGLGMGLYISRCIVEAHEGRIWAESTVGEGSRFYVVLPDALTLEATGPAGPATV